MRRWPHPWVYRGALACLIISLVVGWFSPSKAEESAPSVESLLQEAATLFEKGQWEQALVIYERLTLRAPDNVRVYVGMGACASRLGDYPKAITALQRARRLLPNEPLILGELADAYRNDGQLEEAETWYRRALQWAQGDAAADPHVGLGLVLVEKGRYEEAVAHYRKALAARPGMTAAHYYLGEALLKLNRLDEADRAYAKALEADDSLAYAWFGRGQVAAKRHQFAQARDFYRRAIERDPDAPSFHYALAQVYLRLRDRKAAQEALARYRRAESELYRKDAHRLVQKGQWKDALARLQKAVEHDPTSERALRDRAYVAMQLGDFQAAKADYERVLRMGVHDPQPRFYLGYVEMRLGNLDKAETIFAQLIETFPQFYPSYLQLAIIQQTKGRLDEAEATLNQGLQQKPKWGQAYWRRGLLHQKRGDLTAAEADFRRAIQLVPEIPDPRVALARLLVERGQAEESLSILQPIIERIHKPTHRAVLAWVYFHLGRLQEAHAQIQQAYRDAPEDPEVCELRRQILSLKEDPRTTKEP